MDTDTVIETTTKTVKDAAPTKDRAIAMATTMDRGEVKTTAEAESRDTITTTADDRKAVEAAASIGKAAVPSRQCGLRNDEDFSWFDFSKEHILEAVDGSLQRLKTDHLDNLLLHRPDALMEPEEIAEAFTQLHEVGKVRNFGVSNMNPVMMDMIRAFLPFPITANQAQLSVAFTPSLDAGFHVNIQTPTGIMRDGGLFEYCHYNDIVIQAWSVMQYGFFEGVCIEQ